MTNIHQSEDIAAYNQSSLEELAWAIEADEGQFALLFAHCNYGTLREQLMQQLQTICEVQIDQLRLNPSDIRLYSKIREQVEQESPAALMILGLEAVNNIDDLLRATNQVREEFRKNCDFPLVVWIDDQILGKLKQIAPDFKNWGTTVWFNIPLDISLDYLQQTTDDLFTITLRSGSESFLPNKNILGKNYVLELKAAWENSQASGQALSPELQAGCEFIRGRADYANGDFTSALNHYQISLNYWQQEREGSHIENYRLREANLHFHIGLCYRSQAGREKQEDWLNAEQSWQKCLDIFEQLNRQDLVAKFINSLAEVLAYLEKWSALDRLANKAVKLHNTDNDRVLLAQDYGFLALVALKKSRYQNAEKNALLALEKIQTVPKSQQKYTSLYWLILAQAQEQLGQHPEAVASQQQAAVIEHKEQPLLCLRFLEQLQTLYFNNQNYVAAYQAKQEQLAIKQQLGLIAFVGANRLSQALSFRAVGRKKDLDNLVEKIGSTKNTLTILYGQSGVGKSSLVEAELIPSLKQKKRIQTRDLVTVYLRVYTDWVQTLGEQLQQELEARSLLETISDFSKLKQGEQRRQGEQGKQGEYSLEAIFQEIEQNDKQRNLLTLLIFDQFEEFFFVAKDPKERQQFFQFFSACLSLPFVKVILSLREDYLHLLLQGTRQLNLNAINDDILDKNILYYVGNFSTQQATKVIRDLTESTPFSLDSNLIERLVQDLTNELGEIRPIELQVVGAQLQAENIQTLAAYEQLGEKPKEVLIQGYLEAVIQDCGQENQAIAELVLSLLVDETNRTRPLKTRAELEQELTSLSTDVRDIADKLSLILEIFVLSGLVFRLPESPENRYQLVHDYLVDVILQRQGSSTLAELRTEREQRKIAEAKLKVFLQRALIGSVGAIVILIISTVYAVRFALQVKEGEVINLSQSSRTLYNSNQQLLDPLIEALKARRKLKQAFLVKADIRTEVITALKQALLGVKERNRLVGHKAEVFGVAFSPDGQTIASASYDQTVILWNFQLEDLLIQGCNWVEDYLNNPNINLREEEREICQDISSK